MPISKAVTTPNGAPVNYHRIFKLEVFFEQGYATAIVFSYTAEANLAANIPQTWSWNIPIAIASLGGTDTLAAIEQSLIANSNCPFYQGSIVADSTGSLQSAKDRQWVIIKQARAIAEAQPFLYAGDLYDANKEQISGSVVMAMLAKQASQPFSINWTLKDNTVKTLNADQMIGLGIALGQFITAIYDKARNYRQQINVATTVANVQNVVWVS